MRLELSEAADADLDGIVDYTVARHGHIQAQNYTGGLVSRLNDLAGDPSSCRNIDGLGPHLLQVKYRSHFIIFRIIGDVVRVSRILHERMAAARHLG